MKKILLVTQGFPLGNSERGFLETEYDLLTKKFKVYILALTSEKSQDIDEESVHVFDDYKPHILEVPKQLAYKEVRHDILIARANCNIFKWSKRCKDILCYSARAEHMYREICSMVEQYNIDLIYTYWCIPATIAALRLKNNLQQLKVITRFHGFDVYRERTANDWQPLRDLISTRADLLVFACEYAKKYYMNTFNDNVRSIVSYLGTKEVGIISKLLQKKLKIVSCSAIIPLKRVQMIAEVIALISETIEVEWHHIGGPMTNYDFLDRKGVFYKIWGEVNHETVIDIYKEIKPDMFITLSISEGGAPVSIQEAFSMGIPAIGTDVGGISELIEDAKTGFLLSSETSVYEVSNLINRYYMLTNKEKSLLSLNSYEKWKTMFNAENNANDFINIVNGL